MTPATLYLDFDGVLHVRGQNVFEFAPMLAKLLTEHAPLDLQIVLSTSWVSYHGLRQCIEFMPVEIAKRVVGATFDADEQDEREFNNLTRFQQISRDARHRGLTRWLAIDDDGAGWPSHARNRLILADPVTGLGDAKIQELLGYRLERL